MMIVARENATENHLEVTSILLGTATSKMKQAGAKLCQAQQSLELASLLTTY